MKLSDYAKELGVTYHTAYRYWKLGHIKGEQLPTGTIIIYKDNPGIEKKSEENEQSSNP